MNRDGLREAIDAAVDYAQELANEHDEQSRHVYIAIAEQLLRAVDMLETERA